MKSLPAFMRPGVQRTRSNTAPGAIGRAFIRKCRFRRSSSIRRRSIPKRRGGDWPFLWRGSGKRAGKGSFYLTDAERTLLTAVTAQFNQTAVLLNIGSGYGFSWLEEYGSRISAVLLVWQGGMESGNAVADLLCGNVTPCGQADGYDSARL